MTKTTANNDLINPSFHFHQTIFGQNIRLENNATKAVRHTSFDNGIYLKDIPLKRKGTFFDCFLF